MLLICAEVVPTMRFRILLPVVTRLTGGPAALITYGRKMEELGATVSFSIPSSPWHGKPILAWADGINPEYKRRKNLYISSFLGLIHLISRALRTPTTRRTLYFIVKFFSLWLFTRINKNPMETWKAITNSWRLLLPFVDLPRSTKDEILIATLWPTALVACLTPAHNRIYLMQHYEEVFYPDIPEYSLVRLFCRMSYDLPLVRSANSRWLAQIIKDIHGLDCDLIYVNGLVVDFENSNLSASNLGSEESPLRIAAYIRPEPWKGFASVYRSVQILKREMEIPIELHTFGQLSSYWESVVEKRGFFHHDNLSYQELSQLIADCDLSITGSWYESFPAMPLEAMASNVPVLCTSEGTEEFALDGITATLFQKNNEHDLAIKIKSFLESRNNFINMAAVALNRVSDFSWERAHKVRTEWLLNWQELPIKDFRHSIPIRFNSSILEPPRRIPITRKKRRVIDEFGRCFVLQQGVAWRVKSHKSSLFNRNSHSTYCEFIEFADYWFL